MCTTNASLKTEFHQDLRFWVETNQRLALKVIDLIEAVIRDPFVGLGKPEPHKYLGAGVWSRRLTEEHRLVYVVTTVSTSFNVATIISHDYRLSRLFDSNAESATKRVSCVCAVDW